MKDLIKGNFTVDKLEKKFLVYNRKGILVNSLVELKDNDILFIVSITDWFQWPSMRILKILVDLLIGLWVGDEVEVVAMERTFNLKTISVNPSIFYISNVWSEVDAGNALTI